MYLDRFFAHHPVFTADELSAYARQQGQENPLTRNSLLHYHEASGRLVRVRRGLYAVAPAGVAKENAPVDPFLVAGKAAPDAVLAYHAALAFHGKAYSLHRRFEFLTGTGARAFAFRGDDFRPVRFPKPLLARGQTHFDVAQRERAGVTVEVTGLERALVDVLDRPDLGGGWEEAWRSLESVEFFDLDRVVEYALLLRNATTAAKVGFYLEQHREPLMVPDQHLEKLRAHRPKEPHYLHRGASGARRGKEPVRLLSGWNLVVPESLVLRSWEAVS